MHDRITSMWANILKVLQAAGHSQKALADKVGVNQSTICRLADGEGPEPRWSVGVALIDLAGGRQTLAEQHGIDVEAYMRSGAPPATLDRRNPGRPNPFPDLDRRAPLAAAGEA